MYHWKGAGWEVGTWERSPKRCRRGCQWPPPATASGSAAQPIKKRDRLLKGQNNFSLRYRTLVEHFSVFLQKWRAKVEVSFLRRCVDPNAPKEPLDADAQAEADGGEDEAPPDEESDDGTSLALSPAGPLPTPLRPAWERRGGGNRFTGFRNLGTDFYN